MSTRFLTLTAFALSTLAGVAWISYSFRSIPSPPTHTKIEGVIAQSPERQPISIAGESEASREPILRVFPLAPRTPVPTALRESISTTAPDALPGQDQDVAQLMRDWAVEDPLAAAEFAQTLKPRELREEMMRTIISAWALKDPGSALQWASQLSDSAAAKSAMSSICVAVSQGDPEQALQFAQQYGLDKGSDGLTENLVARWAELDIAAALDWTHQQPAGDRRNDWMSRIAFVQSRSDPADAARLVVKELPPGDPQIEATISVLHQWALQDLDAAMEWVAEFPHGDLRDRAMSELEGLVQYDLIERQE